MSEYSEAAQKLINKLDSRSAVCSVVGLGYVGLPLVAELADAGFKVIAVDVSLEKIEKLKRGESYIIDVPTERLAGHIKNKTIVPTTDFSLLEEADTVNICVPTPLRKTKEPDISYVLAAAQEIKKYLHSGQLVILESTTYPGTTDEVLLPLFEESGLVCGDDFFLAFSPERVDPSNPVYNTKNIPKVVGGMTISCTACAKALYQSAVDTVVEVSSPKTAEMVKLLENTFRSVNIGLVNELCLMSNSLGVDVWEVINAAATKPFGFMPFYPGPGLGGHCIPIDPFYLSWKARVNGFEPRFIELAGDINRSMPMHVVSKIQDALNSAQKSVKASNVYVVGVAYKKNVDDVRESPALEIISVLKEKGANVSVADPYVSKFTLNEEDIEVGDVNADDVKASDIVVILTDHDSIDYKLIAENAQVIIDTRNALCGRDIEAEADLTIIKI